MTFGDRALVVDGGAALEENLERGIVVVPQRIGIGDREFVDEGRTDSYEDFYRLLRGGGTTITATPSPGAYLEAFRRSEAETILCLTIPEGWSGMHSTASLAADMLATEEGRRRVTVIDTGTAAAGFSLVARCAAYLSTSSATASDWEDAVTKACSQVRVYGALATLTYVARSGRVPALLAGISNTLRIRPVFRLVDGGDTGRVGLTRTSGGAIRQLERAAVEELGSEPQWLMIFHADAPDEAAELATKLVGAVHAVRCENLPLSPMFGAHTGPGTIGFAALPWPGGSPPD
ncbi:MAG TPA: DegV family protein [Candidatus Dormibacteraeota bacterium]|jgi:DegV family protein with EDD domain